MLRQLLVASFVLVAHAEATVIHVPGDQPTIQAGIDSASDGDVVQVAPGTYVEKLDFTGKAIEVRGAGPSLSTINPSEASTGKARVVTFNSGEGNESVLSGFTLTGGNAHRGGGASCWNSSPTISGCSITNNSGSWGGGGIHCWKSSPIISECSIAGNSGKLATGGGVSCWDSSPQLANCRITGNSADDGGGILCGYSASPILTNCTIAENTARAKGGGMYCYTLSRPTLTNCILWNDTPTEVAGDTTFCALAYCDVEGGWSGAGNINSNPKFQAQDYKLREDSPCIDAGASSGAPAIDFEGDPRPWGPGYDIGADEYKPVGIDGSTPEGAPLRTRLAAVHPNPFNPQTIIPFDLAHTGAVRLTIHDIRGSLIRTLVHGELESGSHAIRWDGTAQSRSAVSTGVYVVRLETPGKRETQRIVLLK